MHEQEDHALGACGYMRVLSRTPRSFQCLSAESRQRQRSCTAEYFRISRRENRDMRASRLILDTTHRY